MSNVQVASSNLITPAQLQSHLDQGRAKVIDVREPGEFMSEHLPSATLIPLSHLDSAMFELDRVQPLILYCQSGNRSALALEQLKTAGFKDVQHLEGGLLAWKKAGLPTLVNRNAPISLMRQVQIVAGSLTLLGVILGQFVSPVGYLLSAFVGVGLVFAGVSNTCALGLLLAKLPYNKRKAYMPKSV